MLLFSLVIACVLNALHVQAVNPLVNLNYTSYLGTALPNGVTQWLGMRYARPPLGVLRFAAPEDPLPVNPTQMANQVNIP